MWLGVTVAIPEPHRSLLSQARADAGDPLAQIIPPHVTLLPPTEVAESCLEDVDVLLERVAAVNSAFTMSLRGTGTFRPVSPVVFVELEEGWEECADLQAQLNAGVLAQEREFPYHPHVTIAHKLDEAALDDAQESMKEFTGEVTVSTIELFEHSGDVWRELKSFRLGR